MATAEREGETTRRGGQQRIPRPPGARPGSPPPWAALTPEERRFTIDDVRAVAARLPTPRLAPHPPTARPSAVLLPFFEDDGEARVILTKRPETMPSHQGEIAFPGGKLEEGTDPDLRATALREAHEEIGLDSRLVDIVGELDSLTTVMGRFLLTPFVGVLPERPVLVPHVTEVVAVFDPTISELLDDDAYREERWDIPEAFGPEAGIDRAIHFFELPGETVWGATARILTEFLRHLTDARLTELGRK